MSKSPAAPPNIVWITWHDAGRWFGCYGQPHVRTPNVDRLAAEGCRFANLFSASAICSPSRAAIMTGRFCQDNGVMFLTNTANNNRFHPTERHLARRLKEDHGYRTALFGVQHECAHEHVSEIIAPDERFDTDPWPQAPVTAENVEGWLARNGRDGGPFYLQIGTLEAHMNRFYSGEPSSVYPQVADDEGGLAVPPYLKDTPPARAAVANLQGLLHRGDEMIGRVLAALDAAGRADDTMVVMCVDHGPGLPHAKATCRDQGTGVACVARLPGVIPAGSTLDALAAQVDILPTLLPLAGLRTPENVQGRCLADHVLGKRSDELNEAVFSHMVENVRSIRTRTHRLIRNLRPPSRGGGHRCPSVELAPEVRVYDERPRLELYDVREDPYEFRNLIDEPALADVRSDLDGRLWDFLLDHNDFVVNEPVNSDWEAETRRELEAHCAAVGRTPPVVDGLGAR